MDTLNLIDIIKDKYQKFLEGMLYDLLQREINYQQIQMNCLDSSIIINLNNSKKINGGLSHNLKSKYKIGDRVIFNRDIWEVTSIDFKIIKDNQIKILYTLMNIKTKNMEVAYENNIEKLIFDN